MNLTTRSPSLVPSTVMLALLVCGLGSPAQPASAQSAAAVGHSAAPASTGKIRLTRKSAAYWKVTLANPPLSVIGPAEIRELVAILDQIEADPQVRVIDHQAIPDTKKLIDTASMPPDSEMQPGWDAFIASVSRPAAQARLTWLLDKGLQKPGDVEAHLGR